LYKGIFVKLTAVFEQGESGWLVGQIEELPAVISQGKTIDELKGNLRNVLYLYLLAQKEKNDKEYSGKIIVGRELIIA
jgi:predicted RNase H-like HicB family nuclease